VKDGLEFDPSKDPDLSVSRDSGTFSLTAKDGPIHQYQGRYNCYASNELGTAVSKEARIITESKSLSLPRHYRAAHFIACLISLTLPHVVSFLWRESGAQQITAQNQAPCHIQKMAFWGKLQLIVCASHWSALKNSRTNINPRLLPYQTQLC